MPNIGSTGGAIPAGGIAGNVLTKNTGTDYDASWAASSAGSSGAKIWIPGRTYPTTPYRGTDISGSNQLTVYSNGLMFYLITVPNACTITSLSLYNGATAATTGNVCALYADSPSATSGGPGTRLVQGTFGTAAVNSPMVAPLGYTFSGPQNVWVMLAGTQNLYLWTTGNTDTWITTVMVSNSLASGAAMQAANTPYNTKYTSTFTSTTVPADMSTTSTTTVSSYQPLMWVLIA
jgi:hypothetical protein